MGRHSSGQDSQRQDERVPRHGHDGHRPGRVAASEIQARLQAERQRRDEQLLGELGELNQG